MGTGISVLGSFVLLLLLFIYLFIFIFYILYFVAKELQLLLSNVNMMTKI
jgi:hypothetical protein